MDDSGPNRCGGRRSGTGVRDGSFRDGSAGGHPGLVGTGLNAGALWQLDSIAGSFQPIPCARLHRTADSDMPSEPEGKRGPMVVSLREFIFVTVGSVVLSVAILAALWPWARQPRRLLAIGLATAIGIIAWNTALNLTNATGLN